jgi:hypothetical protein
MHAMPIEPQSGWGQFAGGYTLKTMRDWRQRSLWYWSGVAILLAILVSGTPWINAQLATTTATLSGVVTDPSGAVLPKASVTLASPEKGISRTFAADGGGRYSFSQLPPGGYALTVKAKGFETYRQDGIVLNAAMSASQNVTMTIGSEMQSVTVTADASLMNTDNSNIAADIAAQQIVELPLNMRNIYGLATLNSSVQNSSQSQQLLGGNGNGASTDDADQDISFLNFAGGFMGTSGYMLDGSWDTDPEWGAVIYVPSVDAVQEFKVQNNSFTAQYGWSTGNVVNVVTKGGTNAFHGSAYEFYRNDALDANLWFNDHNGAPKQSLSRNQTGASAGGPIYIPGLYKQREKTFIFGVYEHLTLSTPTATTYTVPDTNFRNGNFSEILGGQGKDSSGNPLVDNLGRPVMIGQIYDPRSARAITAGAVDHKTGLTARATGYIRDPIPGNILANLAGYAPDTVGAKLLSYYPKATKDGLTNNMFASGAAAASADEYMVRVDHNFNDLTRAYFRYNYKKEFKVGDAQDWGTDPAGPGNNRPNNRWGMAAGLSKVFSPTLTMNISSGVQIWHETSTNQSRGFDTTTIGLPAYVKQQSPEFPIVNVGGQSNLGPTNHGPIGSVAVDLIKLAGKHTLNFGFMGVELEDDQANFFQTTMDFNGNYTAGPDPVNASSIASGNGVAQMLLGVLDSGKSGQATTQTGTTYNPAVSSHYLGGYLQDDWKATPKLTMNLGIRYEIQTPTTYRHNVGSVFNPDVLNPISYKAGAPYMGALQFLSTDNRDSYNPNYKNVAPRLGLSYQVLPKAVIHGGYGIFYPPSASCCFEVDNDGFAATTQSPLTLNGGINPNSAVTTSNPWPNGYAQITGNSQGEFQQVGFSANSNFRVRPSSYVQQWLLGVQYGITANDQIDVNYVGNRGTRMITANISRHQLDPKYLSMGAAALNTQVANPFFGSINSSSCSLNSPTIAQSQLLSPFPEYCYVSENDAPVGFSDYNALQVAYNHRVSKGLTAMVSYTYSKFLDNVEGNNAWSYAGNSSPANNYNLAAEKSVDGGDIPQALVANYVYQLPVGRGKTFGSGMNRVVDAVVGGWEVSQIATFKQGIPIAISGSGWNSFGGNPRPNVVSNVKVSNPSIKEWFNTGAFKYASYGDFGNAPRFFSNLRGPRFQNWDTSIDKNWRLKDQMRIQFRAELYNTFNHPNFYSPSGTSYGGCDPNSSDASVAQSCSGSNFGQITGAFESRQIQLAGKFYW